MIAEDLRYLSIEAATCLICADSGSCTDPAFCRRDAARYVEKANALFNGVPVTVTTVRLGEVAAFMVTETGHIRVRMPDGSTDIIEGIEVSRW